ncbi:MAG: diaminopimelate decarboxylase [Bacteroidales bacterium]|nr:diaminopimelate decarboxylase [Bacteroidales bacterium]
MKHFPLDKKHIKEILNTFPTPFYIYDEEAVLANARSLSEVFSWNKGSKEFFAVKANPNPFILKILNKHGFGADCSSMDELILVEKCGINGEEVMFTSNNTPAEEFQKAGEMGAIINLDDITHIEFLDKCCGMPSLISFRYNPGNKRKGNFIIGNPEDSKYGLTYDQLFEAYETARQKGATRFGLHTFIASNELDPDYFIETASMLFDLAVELKKRLNMEPEFVNLGGGIGIPYKPEEKSVDLKYVGNRIKIAFEKLLVSNGLSQLKIFMEYGRVVTGPCGYLVTRVRHKKNTYKNFAGLDASMSNLMRPGMYNAYHHISVLGKENSESNVLYDVTGSLCENNDKFAIDRILPELEIGDIIISPKI